MLPTVVPSQQQQQHSHAGKTKRSTLSLLIVGVVFAVQITFAIVFLQRMRSHMHKADREGTGNRVVDTHVILEKGDCVPVGGEDVQRYHALLEKTAEERSHQVHTLEAHSRMRVVVIDTNDVHHKVRQLVGSVHRFHRPSGEMASASGESSGDTDDLQIVVYGIGLDEQLAEEVQLWKNVEYVDIWRKMVKSRRLPLPHKEAGTPSASDTSSLEESEEAKRVHNPEKWRPFILQHALEKYRKILYLDADYIVLSKLTDIEAHLNKYGSFFVRSDDSASEHQDAVMPHCSQRVQGYTIDQYAHKNILLPMTFCAFRDCTAADKKLTGMSLEDALKAVPADHRDSVLCQAPPTNILRLQDEKEDSSLHCYIDTREDLLFTAAQLKWGQTGESKKPLSDDRTWVAIGMPSTSKGSDLSNLPEDLPLFSTFLPSFLKTIRTSKEEKQYLYKFFLVYDAGDPWYDDPTNQKVLHNLFAERTKGYPILPLRTIRAVSTQGWTTFLWNVAFRAALDEGYEYFYQVNDDITFITPDWTDQMVNLLRSSPLHENLGVVGPKDPQHPTVFTQAFVHRTHYDIFGYLYPPTFKNWYSDDWLTVVYKKSNSAFRTDIQLRNSNPKGTRYHYCNEEGRRRFNEATVIGERIVDKWLKSRNVRR